jgi:hypothetical protein
MLALPKSHFVMFFVGGRHFRFSAVSLVTTWFGSVFVVASLWTRCPSTRPSPTWSRTDETSLAIKAFREKHVAGRRSSRCDGIAFPRT